MRYFSIIFKKKAGGQIDEEASVSRNLKPNDLATNNIILDFKDKKVIRCFIDGKVMDTDWNTIVEYYSKVYPDIIKQLESTYENEGQ